MVSGMSFWEKINKKKYFDKLLMPELFKTLKSGYAYDDNVKRESKKLISMIKGNIAKKEATEVELLEAAGMKNKLEKFSNKVKERLKKTKE
jgi:hypothetical protein